MKFPIIIPVTIETPKLVEKDVNFYDFDGTLLYSYTTAEAQALTALPAAPDHSTDTVPLTFQEWNYTLAQVKAAFYKMEIGATYTTTDGKSKFLIELTPRINSKAPVLYLNKSDSSTLSIDWGDGNTTTHTNTGNFTATHTYTNYGEYVISMWISSGSGTYGFGNGTASYSMFGSTSVSFKGLCTRAHIGENVPTIGAYAFYAVVALDYVTISTATTSLGKYAFSTSSLAFIILPSSINTYGTYIFDRCAGLTKIIMSHGTNTIVGYFARGCKALKSIYIPPVIEYISGTYAFNSCDNLKYFYMLCLNPPTLANTNNFTTLNAGSQMYIKNGYLSPWSTYTNWSTFTSSYVQV